MSGAKRLLLCTYYWPPSGGAGVQRSLKFAKYLPEFNIEPIVLTVDENSATYPILDDSLNLEVPENLRVIRTKSREPFAAYSKLSGKKEVPRSGFANEGSPGFKEKLMRFIRGNFFLPDARKGWNKYAIKAASELIESNKIDAILTSSPPHSSQLIGLKLKRKYNLPWIADLRDPWTDIYYYKQLYPTYIAKLLDARYERLVLKKADKIIVVSESMKTLFLKKYKEISQDKIIVVSNGYDLDDFSKTQYPENKVFTICYTGTIAKSYDLETFASACKVAFTDKKRDVKIRFVGSSGNLPLTVLKQFGLSDFTEIIPSVDHKTSIVYLQTSDALLLLIPDSPENKGILTGKLFEYLGSGKPIIGIGPEDGDALKIIAECQAGNLIQYGNAEELSIYLDRLFLLWEGGQITQSNENREKYSRKAQSELLAKEIKALF